MDKALLTDIKKKLYIRSSLISLGSLDELLGINEYLSPDEILLEIMKKSLREFELYFPLVIDMKIYRDQMKNCSGLDGYMEIKSNFSLYLECKIDEGQIILVPNSIPKWRIGNISYPTAGNYTYFSDYRRPYVFMSDVPSNDVFYIKGICSRPIIPDFTEEKSFNSLSEKAAIYWMNVEEGAYGTYFMDVCMLNLLDFIRQMKASIQLPNFSVDILGNVDSAYMELRARWEQTALQAGWRGELLI